MTKITDKTISNAKPRSELYPISIGENIYCIVRPTGKKIWSLRFVNPETGKEANHKLGEYFKDSTKAAHVSLSQARRLADDAKHLISQGIHPKREQERLKVANMAKSEKTFEYIARQWWEIQREGWDEKNANKILRGLEEDVFKVMGKLQVDQISAPDVLKMLRKIEGRQAYDYMHRTKQRCSLIFGFAIGEGLIDRNPIPDIQGNLKKYRGKHYSCLRADELPEFLDALDTWKNPVVRLALYLVIHTYLRTDELRVATWDQIDFDERVWRVPAETMKMDNEHWVPLTDQAVALLRELEAYRKGNYLFSVTSKHKPMSSGTMIQAIYDLGFKGRCTVHGFRATFSTTANDASWNSDYIEAALAHKVGGVRGSYNHSTYIEQRKELMQWYSNYIDALCTVGDVVPIGKKTGLNA